MDDMKTYTMQELLDADFSVRDLERDQAICDIATPGNWHFHDDRSPQICEVGEDSDDGSNWPLTISTDSDAAIINVHNAIFIATARAALPYWIAEAKRLRDVEKWQAAEIKRLKTELDSLKAK